jgi:CelD/BcsL family acetyltransferase involved in cellulose biosynthesis
MSIRFGEIIYAVLLINTGIHLNYYPGIVGLYLRAKEASLKGIKTINIGVGDHGYKSQASSYQVKTFETIIANPSSLKGKIYTKWLCKKLSM